LEVFEGALSIEWRSKKISLQICVVDLQTINLAPRARREGSRPVVILDGSEHIIIDISTHTVHQGHRLSAKDKGSK